MDTFKNVLLVVDPSRSTQAAVTRALALVRDANSRMTIAAVTETGVSGAGISDVINYKQKQLNAITESIDNVKVHVETKVLVGRAFSEIILDVIKNERDLVIKPVEPRRAGYKLFAGTDFKLLRKCPCPVLLLRDLENARFSKVAAAVDVESLNPENDSLSKDILNLASTIAARNASAFHVVHAWEIEQEEYLRSPRTGLSHDDIEQLRRNEYEKRQSKISEWIAESCSETNDNSANSSPQVHLENGPARAEIPEFLTEVNADLIVMGTIGRTGIPGFFIGNTAEEILNQVDCSVLALKPKGFVSPVAEAEVRKRAELRSVS